MHIVHRIILSTIHLSTLARALTYSLGQATQCGDLQVTWSDATGGDLNLLVLPVISSLSAWYPTPDVRADIEPTSVTQTDHGTGSVVQTFKIPSTASSPYTLKNFLLPSGAKYVASLWDDGGYSATKPTEIMSKSRPPHDVDFEPVLISRRPP